MSVSNASSAGTVCSWFYLPWPWPPAKPITLIGRRLNGYALRVTCEPTRQIHAQILNPQSAEAILEISSCPIYLTEPGFVFLGVAWELPSLMRIHLNDTIVADTDSVSPDSYEVPKRKPLKPEDREDFSRESATKRIQRRGTITGYQHNPRRIPGDRQHLIKQLADEAAQVRGLLLLLDGGQLAFARSLANSLGLLMAEGTPMPLI